MKKEIAVFVLAGVGIFAAGAIVVAQTTTAATSSAPQQGAAAQGTGTHMGGENETSSRMRGEGNATATSARARLKPDAGPLSGESHKGAVAEAVRKLLDAANRQGGIGEQVRVIARAQNDSAATSSKDIDKVASRSALKTFLVGSDYKTLGELRSELVGTRNRIEQLTRLAADATTDTDKTDIQNQIEVLQTEATKIDAFVKAQESKFSLFGWMVKLFQ